MTNSTTKINDQTLETESGFSVSASKMITLKITKEIISKIRNWNGSNFDKARMFKIVDSMTKIEGKQSHYPLFSGYKTFIQQNIISNFDTVNKVLTEMNNLGIIEIGISERYNPYNHNKKLETLIISEAYQTEEPKYYTFTDSDEEYKYLLKCNDVRKTSNTKRLNDDQIVIPKEFLDLIPGEQLKSIIRDRMEGESIKSEANSSTNGRIVTIYSNLKKNLRSELIDNRTGFKLSSMDLKSSQFSFFLAYLKQRVRNENTVKEIIKLQNLQKTSDFYTFMAKEINVQRCAVKRLVMKMLCGDWRTHFSNFTTDCFKPETVEWFNNNNISIVCTWNKMMLKFKTLFPNIVAYMFSVMSNKTASKSKITIAYELQKMESQFMQELIKHSRRLSLKSGGEFQFFTVYDCIFFSSDYWAKVKKIMDDQISYWNNKKMLVCSVHEDRLPLISSSTTHLAPLVNNFSIVEQKVSIGKKEGREGGFNTNFSNHDTKNEISGTNEVSMSGANDYQGKMIIIDQIRVIDNNGSYAWMYRGTGKQQMKVSCKKMTKEQFLAKVNEKFRIGEWK